MKRRTFVVESDMYPFKVAFWFGPWSEQPFGAWLKRQSLWTGAGRPLDTPSGHGACYNFGTGCAIWMPSPPKSAKEHGALTHEIVHAITHAGQELGFTLSGDSDEFYAYMAGFLTFEALTRVRR